MILGKDMMPKIKEMSFAMGITLGSCMIGYLMVTGKWKNCLDIYQIIQKKAGIV